MVCIIFIFAISFIIFYCKDYHNLEKIINIIACFKLNPNLKKNFLNQKKRENKINAKKIKSIVVINNHKIKNKGKAMIFNKEDKIKLKSFVKNKKRLRIKNVNVFGESDNKCANPNKKMKNIFNNNLNFNINVSSKNIKFNKNNISNKVKSSVINKSKYPYNMNENQIYEMFLKINNNSDSELNELDYNSSIKIDKRTYFNIIYLY